MLHSLQSRARGDSDVVLMAEQSRELGKLFFSWGKYAAAYDYFEHAANEDDDLGVAWKSDCLFVGVGVEKDRGEAKETLLFGRDDSGKIT